MFGNKKLKLSPHNENTLLIELNKIIEDAANQTAELINDGTIDSNITYPPNNGFTEAEKIELIRLRNNDELKSALRKSIADACSASIFNFLNLIDGTGDPEVGEWQGQGISLIDKSENLDESYNFLHDGLFEKYWDWRNTRNKNWKLDILDE